MSTWKDIDRRNWFSDISIASDVCDALEGIVEDETGFKKKPFYLPNFLGGSYIYLAKRKPKKSEVFFKEGIFAIGLVSKMNVIVPDGSFKIPIFVKSPHRLLLGGEQRIDRYLIN